MENKNNITFVIFTFNEENRIEYPIRNFINYGNVIIIDNFSSDNTQQIAEKLGAKVYKYKNKGYCDTPEELAFVKSKIKTDYMTWSCADYMFDKGLLNEIIKVTNKGFHDSISSIMMQYHYGIIGLNFMTYNWRGKKQSSNPIVFKKNIISFEGIIHNNMKIKYKNNYIVNQKYKCHHFSEYNINKFELSVNNYSNIESKMLYNNGIKSNLTKTIIKIIFYFIKYYFIDGAFKKGKLGFIMVMNYMFFYFNIWAKQYELEKGITLEYIKKEYNKEKKLILKSIK